jgi:hypothetical protein
MGAAAALQRQRRPNQEASGRAWRRPGRSGGDQIRRRLARGGPMAPERAPILEPDLGNLELDLDYLELNLDM